ncbi:MAG: hypothetical protein CVU81_00040 [Euryarchaeota archaeon HGW-Euryarchaeota-1]|nr:MAG: hypothetical protein CVU81_00040 [Euryarchaeota archaeon HGW-Euryarchaeota-1]
MLEFLNFYFPVSGIDANILYLALVGLVIGFLSGLLGVGGGFIMVPVLTLAFGVPMKIAIGTDTFYIVVTALSGAYKHIKNGFVNFKIVGVIAASAIFAAQLGAMLCIETPKETVQLLFGILLLLIAFNMLIKTNIFNKNKKEGNIERYGFWTEFKEEKYFVSIPKALGIGLLVGGFSGFFGVGGAVVLIPLMLSVLRLPMHLVVGSSLLVVMLSALSGSTRYFLEGFVDIQLGIALLCGSIIGAYIGAHISSKTKPEKLKKVFAVMLIIVGLKMTGFI